MNLFSELPKSESYVELENVGKEPLFYNSECINPGDRFIVEGSDIAKAENVLAFSQVVKIRG